MVFLIFVLSCNLYENREIKTNLTPTLSVNGEGGRTEIQALWTEWDTGYRKQKIERQKTENRTHLTPSLSKGEGVMPISKNETMRI